MTAITPEELKERVAVVKRFRELLREQRERFSNYLDVLDKQKVVVEKGNAEDILSHIEIEEKMLSDIFSIQKALAPLEPLYRTSVKTVKAPDVAEIQSALENLKTEAVQKVKQNRDILGIRMSELKKQMEVLRNNPYARRSVRFMAGDNASFVDMEG
ncbi:MAG: flagellar biosynthesis protein FlgN [Treponema sp.]|jgi:hypothetical protein|nr:flagellar biosynthesis protein FlgN [Treponema sp.]